MIEGLGFLVLGVFAVAYLYDLLEALLDNWFYPAFVAGYYGVFYGMFKVLQSMHGG